MSFASAATVLDAMISGGRVVFSFAGGILTSSKSFKEPWPIMFRGSEKTPSNWANHSWERLSEI